MKRKYHVSMELVSAGDNGRELTLDEIKHCISTEIERVGEVDIAAFEEWESRNVRVEYIDVPVKSLDRILVETRTLYGPVVGMLKLHKHCAVRVYLPKEYTADDLTRILAGAISKVK